MLTGKVACFHCVWLRVAPRILHSASLMYPSNSCHTAAWLVGFVVLSVNMTLGMERQEQEQDILEEGIPQNIGILILCWDIVKS